MDSGTGNGKTISEAGTWPGVPLPLGSLPHPPQVASGGWGRDSRPRTLGRAKGKRIQCFFVVTGLGGGGLSLFFGWFPRSLAESPSDPWQDVGGFLFRETYGLKTNDSKHFQTFKNK